MLNVCQYNECIKRNRFIFILLFIIISVDCHLMPIMIFLNRVKYRICVEANLYNHMQQNAINLSQVDKYAVVLSIAIKRIH